METGFIFFILASFLVQIKAQVEPLQVTFKEPKDRHVELGVEVSLDFVVNRSPMFGLGNSVIMMRHRMENGQMVSSELSDVGKLLDDAPPSYYEVNIDQKEPSLTIHFKILQVRDVDDATYMVKAISKDPPMETNTSLKIVVLRDNTKQQMKFGDKDFFSESMKVPFEVDAGMYPVTCSSEGSNPATEDVRIYWKGETVPVSAPVIEPLDTPLHRYRTTVTAEVDIMLADSGQEVECVSKSKMGTQLFTKAPIKVNVYDPKVNCTDTTAFVGKRYPVLSCTVTESGHEIEEYAYQFGKTGDVIKVGDQTGDYDEVLKTDLGDSKVKVDLKLHRVKDSHFRHYYLLITQKNGHITKVPVVLTKVEGPKDSSNMLGASLTTFALCVVCALWKTL